MKENKPKKEKKPIKCRKKVTMYGAAYINENGCVEIKHIKPTRTEVVPLAESATSICQINMLVPSDKNQWTITVDECDSKGNVLRVRKFKLETKERPVVWGTNRLTDEAVNAYIEQYIGWNDTKEVDNFKECNGVYNKYSNPRSPQIN